MSTLRMTCRFCSAPLDITEGSKYADCPYCGKKQPIVDDPFSESKKAPTPTAKSEEQNNVVIIQKNTQHNWGILGGCIGIVVLIIVIFALVKCSGKSGAKRLPEPQPSRTQARIEPIKNPSKNVYQTQPVNSDLDSGRAYWQTKQEATIANKRYAQAWRMIPANLRNSLQRQISDLPKKVDQKCKSYSYGFSEGYARKWAYLKCSVDHENILSDGIERYASELNAGQNPNFFDYVDPVGLIETPMQR